MHTAVPRQSADTAAAEPSAQVTVAVLSVLSMATVTTVAPAEFLYTMGTELALAAEFCVS